MKKDKRETDFNGYGLENGWKYFNILFFFFK